MDSRFGALILIIGSIYVFFLILHNIGLINSDAFTFTSKYSLIFFAVLISTLILGNRFKIDEEIKKFIVRETLRSYVHEIIIQNNQYYFVGFKIIPKKVPEDAEVNYIGETYGGIEGVFRNKSRQLQIMVVTLIEPSPGSVIIFYSKVDKLDRKNWVNFVDEALYLKYSIEGSAPHVSLEPVNLKTTPAFPIPTVIDIGSG